MASQKNKILLEKYWEATTTSEEEAALQEQFRRQREVGREEEKYGVLFEYRQALEQQDSESFDLSFLDKAADEVPAQWPVFSLPGRRTLRMWATGLAASVLLAVFSISYQWPRTQTLEARSMKMEKAYTETLAALQLVADKLNQGNASIHEIGVFDRTTKQIIHEK
jgi:hypothetical protein